MKKIDYYILAESEEVIGRQLVSELKKLDNVKILTMDETKLQERAEIIIGFESQEKVVFVLSQERMKDEDIEFYIGPDFSWLLDPVKNYSTMVVSTLSNSGVIVTRFRELIREEIINGGGILLEMMAQKYKNIESFRANPNFMSYSGGVLAHNLEISAEGLVMSLVSDGGARKKAALWNSMDMGDGTKSFSTSIPYKPYDLIADYVAIHKSEGVWPDFMGLNGQTVEIPEDVDMTSLYDAVKVAYTGANSIVEDILLFNVVPQNVANMDINFMGDTYQQYDIKAMDDSIVYIYKSNRTSELLRVKISFYMQFTEGKGYQRNVSFAKARPAGLSFGSLKYTDVPSDLKTMKEVIDFIEAY